LRPMPGHDPRLHRRHPAAPRRRLPRPSTRGLAMTPTFAEAAQQGDFDPPDGTYTVKVSTTTARVARTTGKPFAVIVLQITAGPDVGRTFDQYLNLSNDVGQRIAREAFITYGVDPLALDQLDPETDIAALDVL